MIFLSRPPYAPSTMIRCLALLFLIFAWAVPANAEKRVALVIGNSAYQNAPTLENPRNDAQDIAAVFRRLGFEVVEGVDLDHKKMRRIIRRFAKALETAKAGVLFYAGHGIQVSGKNYLVPIDAKLNDTIAIDFELIRLDLIHTAMEQSTKTNILFLDACRDNPLARNLSLGMGTRSVSIGRGLATVESGIGSLISFSTQPGNYALDGDTGRNSPYTSALIANLNAGHHELSDLLIRVRREVMAMTDAKQVPWEHSSLTRPFYFGKSDKQKPSPPVGQAKPPTDSEGSHWRFVATSRQPELLKFFLRKYPKGRHAPSAKLILEQLESEKPRKERASSATDLTTGIQTELARLGCYRGPIDGKWGRRTSLGLQRINARFEKRYATSGPEQVTLARLSKLEGIVCKSTKQRVPQRTQKTKERRVINKAKGKRSKTTGRTGSQDKVAKRKSNSRHSQSRRECAAWRRCASGGNVTGKGMTSIVCGGRPIGCW